MGGEHSGPPANLGAAANLFFWPLIAAAAAGNAFAAQAEMTARLFDPPQPAPEKLGWSAPNHVRLELATMALRDFSLEHEGMPTLLCAPYALHGAEITDLAPGHSLVETLKTSGCRHLFVTDWHSASAEMREFTIDTYLAELNITIDEIGPPVDLVGLCQGGWLALVYAARFPAKVRKLVLAGAPIDTDAADSSLTTAAHALPLGLFDELTRLGDGRAIGRRAANLWEPTLKAADQAQALQIDRQDLLGESALCRRFDQWNNATVDLPGAFYRQVIQWLFKENRLASGRLTALGRSVDLGELRHPMFLIAAQHDDVVPPEQLLALRRLVGTSEQDLQCVTEPGGHLSLFVGSRTLQSAWTRAAAWLGEKPAD
jgi:poly(3-hydroxyalkanoate) synthetase